MVTAMATVTGVPSRRSRAMLFFHSSVSFKEMDFRTDVHSHILPGVDDGFRHADNSVQALERMHEAGLEHSILTPHIFPELYPANDPAGIRARFGELSARFSGTGVSCRIAGEHMVYNGIEDEFSNAADDGLLSMPGRHFLIEMSYAYESQNIREFIFRLNINGLHPILAHPERYSFYSAALDEIRSIADMDTGLQLNILSLGGFYGKTAMLKAEKMLENGMYSYLGTDLHSLSQLESLFSLKISRKHVAAVEKLLQNNDSLWSASEPETSE